MVAVAAQWQRKGGGGGGGQGLAAKVASNKSVDVHMTVCDDKSGQGKTTQQSTNDGRSKRGLWWWWQW